MLHEEKQYNVLGYQSIPLKSGETLEESKLSSFHRDIEGTISKRSSRGKNPRIKAVSTSTAESHPQNKKKISKGKSKRSKKNTLTIQSLKKLQAELTSKGKDSTRSWIKRSRGKSQKLWLPTKTGYAVSLGSTFHGYSDASESISWSSMVIYKPNTKNSQTTFCPSSMYSLVDTTVHGELQGRVALKKARKKTLQKNENLLASRLKREKNKIQVNDDDDFIVACKLIRVFPSKKQRRVLNDWLASYRKTKNLSHTAIEKGSPINEVSLRNQFVIKKNMSDENKKRYSWLFRTPKRIREYGVKDLVSNYRTAFTCLKKKTIRHFRIRPKSSKDPNQNCSLPHESSYLFPNKILRVCGQDLRLQELPIDIKEQTPVEANMRLVKRHNFYYVAFPHRIKPFYYDIEPVEKDASIDPGVDIYGTYYSPSEEFGFYGIDVKNKLKSLYKKYDSIQKNLKGRKNLKTILKRIQRRIDTLIDDFQWKTVHALLKRFGRIIIPRLYVHKSNKTVKRYLNDMKHCRFVDRLIYKSLFYKNREVHVGKEHHTTRTCTSCLRDKKVGNSRIYNCSCSFSIHRDLNGARNMILKHAIIT